jgi:pyrimidine operon attenuation protein/uracil phosphoribosyltransferase
MNTVETKPVLDAEEVKRKIRRMAFEIAERNADCDSLTIAGIQGNGEVVARNVLKELQQIITCNMELITIQIDKKHPLHAVIEPDTDFNGKTIIVVDDVADTGKILLYSVKPFLAFLPRSIQSLVLVERSHKLFPVQTDYVGLSIATTLQEHIVVKTEGDAITGAWLY